MLSNTVSHEDFAIAYTTKSQPWAVCPQRQRSIYTAISTLRYRPSSHVHGLPAGQHLATRMPHATHQSGPVVRLDCCKRELGVTRWQTTGSIRFSRIDRSTLALEKGFRARVDCLPVQSFHHLLLLSFCVSYTLAVGGTYQRLDMVSFCTQDGKLNLMMMVFKQIRTDADSRSTTVRRSEERSAIRERQIPKQPP